MAALLVAHTGLLLLMLAGTVPASAAPTLPGDQYEDLTNAVARLERKFDQNFARLDERFSRLEAWLSALLPKNGSADHEETSTTPPFSTTEDPRDSTTDAPAVVCERGMGVNKSESLPKFAVLYDDIVGGDILCDTETDGGGWIVFQRRFNGDVNFFRNWASYRDGFGSFTGDFWLGNEAVYNLTNTYVYELRIDFREREKDMHAVYSPFRLEDEEGKYRLRIGEFSGTARDELSRRHKDMAFTTFDRDNDEYRGYSCADYANGAWWYQSCGAPNLNGRWGGSNYAGVYWTTSYVDLSLTEMKIRRVKVGP